MIYATILLALILALCIARIYFLNTEVKALDDAGEKFASQVESWRDSSAKGGVAVVHEMPKEVQEALTESEWANNARDSKKESRTIWMGASLMVLIALITSIVEMAQNTY